jgi:PAS domain S-box-containing protein
MDSDGIAANACEQGEALIDQLREQMSALIEENANLRLLDDVLRRNNALFEALLAHSSVGITLTGPDRRIVRVVQGLTGFSPADLSGVLIESLAVPEDRAVIVEAYRLLMSRSCQQVKREIRVARADGAVRRFAVTLTDMLDDQNVQGIVWNYQDITVQGEPEMNQFANGSLETSKVE